MRVRQDEHGREGNVGMACFATENQAKLAIIMLNKTKQYIANEYKHKKQTHNLHKVYKRKIKVTRKLLKK